MIASPLLILSAIVIVALGIWGGAPEKLAAALFATLHLVTPLIDHLSVGHLRWAVAITSLLTFASLTWLAIRNDRWWLVFAAGCQLLALSTHIISLLQIDSLIWTAVSLRWLSWGCVLLCALFGLWEGRALDRIRRSAESAYDDASPLQKWLG